MLVRRDDLQRMPPRAVIIDVAIDQGGCVETSRPTTHANPTYIVDDVVHYCVTNMPGAVGRTSTYALTNVTLPYVLQLANKGVDRACRENAGLAAGVNIKQGKVTNAAVAETFGLECHPLSKAIAVINSARRPIISWRWPILVVWCGVPVLLRALRPALPDRGPARHHRPVRRSTVTG